MTKGSYDCLIVRPVFAVNSKSKSIDKLLVKEGDEVVKDQRLLQIDDGIYVNAPFAGSVVSLPFHPGENIPPQATVLELQNLRERYVEASLEQQGALRVRKKMPVSLQFESIRNQRFAGEVQSIYPKENQFLVHIAVEQLPDEVLPGMASDIAIEVARKEQALLIPMIAIQNGQVLIQRGGKKTKVKIEVGNTDGEWAEVLGDSILDSDQIYLRK